MPETLEQLVAFLAAGAAPGARERLVSRGLARGMIWRGGELPTGSPRFGPALTAELLDHGYSLLGKAIALRDLEGSSSRVRDSLVVAAESIESAARNGKRDEVRDSHLVIAAAAFHLARYSARSFCLVPETALAGNLSTGERLLIGLMRRDLRYVRELSTRWLRSPEHQDSGVALRLADPTSEFGIEDAEIVAITRQFVKAMASLLGALESGAVTAIEAAREGYSLAAEVAVTRRYVSLWWVTTLARHLADDLWSNSLHNVLPRTIEGPDADRWNALRNHFIAVLHSRPQANVELWPSQLDAARRAIDATDDLVVALPTSAGKTRIAELCILRALAQNRRVVYVTPLRALSAQLERILSRTFIPLGASVTALYGASGIAQADVATMKDGKIVVATPEKLDFALRVEPGVLDDVGLVVLDEGHMIGFGQREFRYEVLVQRLLRRTDAEARRIVCLSAVFSAGEAFQDFTAWIRSDSEGAAIQSTWRPTRERVGTITWRDGGGRLQLAVDAERPFVPRFVPAEAPLGRRRNAFPNNDPELIVATTKAFIADKHRVLVYCPQRRSVESLAEEFLKLNRQGHVPNLLPPGSNIDRALMTGEEWLGPNHVALRALRIGVGVHHALLPRPFLAEIEDLLDRKMLPVVVASPTVAQGLDLSCSVLVFRSIYRYRDQLIDPGEFANVRGRAGRAFVDLDGITVYPIYEAGASRQRRLASFNQLLAQAEQRDLESGLVTLIDTLATFIARSFHIDRNALLELVTNQAVNWGQFAGEQVGAAPAGADEEEQEELPPEVVVRMLLREVDTVILSTIEDPTIGLDMVAGALDEALQSSFWARRLSRRDAPARTLLPGLLHSRAIWIWGVTDDNRRRGYYAAGVGVATGQYLDENVAQLIALLLASEVALTTGAIAESAAPLSKAAEILSRVAPFKFDYRPGNWRDVLTAWISGQSVAGLVEEEAGVGFVQADIVYRLVWAVEAARVHGLARETAGASDLTGLLPLVLTYGLPSPGTILLARAGLASRQMIMRLVTQFHDVFQNQEEPRALIRALDERIEDAFWGNDVWIRLWREFADRWLDPQGGAWDDSNAEAQVLWAPSVAVPAVGEPIRLVHDSREGITYVCTDELETLGQLVLPLSIAGRGSVSGTVTGPDRVILHLFAPRA